MFFLGEKRFVEITVVLHSIKDFKAKMTEEVAQGKILTPFNLGALGDGSSAFVANYRFIKEVTKGVQSSWIVNMINHFAVISVSILNALGFWLSLFTKTFFVRNLQFSSSPRQ